MKIKYVFFLILLSNHLAVKVKVEYDPELDVLIHNGKIYIPSTSNSFELETKVSNFRKLYDLEETEAKHESYGHGEREEEEELVSGATFWFYMFMILCNFDLILSFNFICWTNVWANCGLSVYR